MQTFCLKHKFTFLLLFGFKASERWAADEAELGWNWIGFRNKIQVIGKN